MGAVGCLLGQASLLGGCMENSVLMFIMDGVVKSIQETSGFGFPVILVGSLDVSGTCKLHLSCRI